MNANHQAVLKEINSAIRGARQRVKEKRVQRSFEAGVLAIESALRGVSEADSNNTVTRRIRRDMAVMHGVQR